jgi:hypothetical protein
MYIARNDLSTVGIVTDGCGSSSYSEVGAKLATRLLAESIQAEASRNPAKINWQRIRQHLLADLDALARRMGGSYRRTVEDYFLFTVVGVLLDQTMATFFAIGDGVVIVNGETQQLGPFAENMPPYVGYGLIGDSIREKGLADQRFEIIQQVKLTDLQHFLIGCDGVIDLMHVAERCLPGSSQTVGGIEQFWQQDRYYGNPELINRRLKLVARDWPRHDPEPGLLPDDTTLIVGRRSPVNQPLD